MNPIEKWMLRALADHGAVATPPGDNNYTMNLQLADTSVPIKIAAVRIVDTLRRSTLVKGEPKKLSLADLTQINDVLTLGENATLKQSAGTITLSITFSTPLAETQSKLHKIADLMDTIDQKPSALKPVEQAAYSTFRAAGLPVKSVRAVHNDLQVSFTSHDMDEEHKNTLFKVLNETGLLDRTNVRTAMTPLVDEDGAIMWHMPMPDHSVREAQIGFFKAEIMLRQLAETAPRPSWKEKVTQSTFVSGEGLRKQ